MKRNFVPLFALFLLISSGATGAATASFEIDSGRPMVQLTVDGKGPFPFVFDTGSPGLLVLPSLVDELGLEIVGSEELQTPAGGTPVTVDVVEIDSIALGGAEALGLTAMVLDMDGHGLGMGVVGPVLFREYGAITIDFEHNTITVGADASDTGIQTWQPFGESAPLLDVAVRIGDLSIDGHLDTGNPGVLSVPAEYENSLPLSGPVETVGRARTADAEFEIRGAPINVSAKVGDAEIPLRQILFSELPVANLGTAGCRGLVLHIDWENERFGLSGTGEPSARPRRVVRKEPSGDGPRFGVMATPQPDGSIAVRDTEPGSAAEAIGLVPGDRIIAVNGTPTRDLDPVQIRSGLATPNLELTVERDGETLTLKLED